MSIQTSAPQIVLTASAGIAALDAARAARLARPERDFGIGYGRSSGYGSPRGYTQASLAAPRFRCA